MDLIGTSRKGNCLLCYFAGETDIPIVVAATTTEELASAIAEFCTGDIDSDETESILDQVREHDFSADDSQKLVIDFEIGFVSFEDVYFYTKEFRPVDTESTGKGER